MAANTVTLTKIRDWTTTVQLRIFTYTSDAAWRSAQGHVVHRVNDHGNWVYKVVDLRGGVATKDNLAQVREDIAWLIERGR